MSRWSPPILLSILIILGLIGCAKEKAGMPPLPPAQTMDPGTMAIVEFPPDGRWYDSGFVARPGDTLVFEPLGAAADLGRGTLLSHVGRSMTHLIEAGKPLRVTEAGEVAFRFDKTRAGYFEAQVVQIRIKNLPRQDSPHQSPGQNGS